MNRILCGIIYSLYMIDSFRTEYRNHQGFTLIELLIVVAIIGILSSIVVVTLADQGDKADDAKIQFEIRQLPTAAAVYIRTEGVDGYTSFCADSKIESVLESLHKTLGDDTSLSNVTVGETANVRCNDAKEAWAVWSKLKSGDTVYWCIDSKSGGAKKLSAAPTDNAATVCP